MNPPHDQRISDLLLKASELEGEARSDFLDSACEGDAALRAEVDALLARDEDTATLPTSEMTTQEIHGNLRPFPHPSVVGPYVIVTTLGKGGMGVVYLAEQEKPIRRRVALKLIRLGIESRAVVQRFESERQALAMMDHPNISKVYDAGATREGLPYFAMEYIEGTPILDYCDSRCLGIRKRLEMFLQVCSGVQHAHRKGIIHRDLKSSNVLVTTVDGHEVPKIIDFGVAKAVSQEVTDETRLTAFGQLLGTPSYMSPEQADPGNLDIDTRADVYSLGVLLYQLLTGALPFDLAEFRGLSWDDIRQKIQYVDPPTPSARLDTSPPENRARQRGTDPRNLRRKLRGELDWIVMKALEKERERRYQAPSELAADIERYLKDEPVEAVAPGPVYRLLKFVRRHRTAVATSAMVLAVLLVGIVGTTLGLVRAIRAERVAEEAAIEDLWMQARQLGMQQKTQEALGPLSDILDRKPRHTQALRKRSRSYLALSRDEADPARRDRLLDLALADATQIVELLPDVAWPYTLRAFIARHSGLSELAESDEQQTTALGSGSPINAELEVAGLLALEAGDSRAAIGHYSEVLSRDPGLVSARSNRAWLYEKEDRVEEAILDYRILAALTPDDYFFFHRLGHLLTASGDLSEGELAYRQGLKILVESGRDVGENLAPLHQGLSDNYLQQGREAGDQDVALKLFRRAEREAKDSLGLFSEQDPHRIQAYLNLGASLMEQHRRSIKPNPERVEAAIESYDTALSLLQADGAEAGSQLHAHALVNQCDLLIQTERLEQALSVCQEVTEVLPDDPDGFYNLAGAYMLANRINETYAALEKDYDLGDRDHEYLVSDPWFSSLHDDPRFLALIERMKASPKP